MAGRHSKRRGADVSIPEQWVPRLVRTVDERTPAEYLMSDEFVVAHCHAARTQVLCGARVLAASVRARWAPSPLDQALACGITHLASLKRGAVTTRRPRSLSSTATDPAGRWCVRRAGITPRRRPDSRLAAGAAAPDSRRPAGPYLLVQTSGRDTIPAPTEK
ncbi:MAG: hypothetical protein ACRDQ4_20300 [Pseudonocardiaceae bacterium]